ncbi:MAG: hypothetical protein JEZ09_18820 [Salinivirgaceae bacterium]|nr:hypothetical protein [Salinivirgaceae bacterium]
MRNYVKLKIKEDGEVIIIDEYLDCITKEQQMTETFYTKINDAQSGAAFFYINK